MMSLLRHSIGRGCYIKFHAEIWLFDSIFLIIKGLNVKNDEIHSHLYLWVHITLSCKFLHWLITDTVSNIIFVQSGNACQPCSLNLIQFLCFIVCLCVYILYTCTWQEVRKNNVRTYQKESQSASIEDHYTAVDLQMFCTQEVQ